MGRKLDEVRVLPVHHKKDITPGALALVPLRWMRLEKEEEPKLSWLRRHVAEEDIAGRSMLSLGDFLDLGFS